MFMLLVVAVFSAAAYLAGAKYGQPALAKIEELASRCPVLSKDPSKKD